MCPPSVQKSPGPNFDWDDVRIFSALAEIGTLSGAARQLGVEHSTVARRIDALERALQLRLFDRLPRSWQLTAEGEALLTHATHMRAGADALRRGVAGAEAHTGNVRVSAPPSFASRFLLPRLTPRLAAWPELTLELVGETREASLSRHESDLALRLGRPTEEGLATRHLATLGFALYATPDYLQRIEAPAWRLLGYDESLGHVPQQRWLDEIAAGRRYALRSNDLGAVWQACRDSLGVALLPHFLGAPDHMLRRIDAPACPVRRELWLVVHPDLRRAPRVRRMADLLAEVIGAAVSLLADGH